MILSEDIKKNYSTAKKFISQKKIQNIIFIILFLSILFLGIWIRIQPLPNLIDPTTGDYTPLALDPYYFLRISETLVETGGELPPFDNMHYLGLNPPWHHEILPQSTVFIYQIMNSLDSDITLRLANVLNPVIFFVLGMIVFFFLVYLITRNPWIALLSSFILTVIPPYLYRTLAGFSDHESIGMFGFFLALIAFFYGLLYLNKILSGEKKFKSQFILPGLGIVAGFFTAFSIVTWTGGSNFLFMILPLSFLIYFSLNKKGGAAKSLVFYSSWILGTIFGSAIFSYSIESLLKGSMLSASGSLTLIVLLYLVFEFAMAKIKMPSRFFEKNKKIISIAVLVIVAGLLYQIFVGSVFDFIINIINKIIYPFGTGRVGLTVAENKQPYLSDWIGQIGKFVFYLFLFGCFLVGGKLAKGISRKKYKYLFMTSFSIFIFGILFSRISASSVLNGENFISRALFFLSFLFVVIISIYTYFKSDWKIETEWILVVAWMIPMLFAVRSAIRVFFAIVPFVSFIISWALFEVGKYFRNSKDELQKFFSFVIFAALIIGLIFVLTGFTQSVIAQSKYQTPSYNSDWQNAMEWVRDNTPENSVFLHWWDYGYWVQTGGQRPSLTDGGHFNGYWDHLVGRYVLTTPSPETAKSFMKTHNISYLLIDPTDIGKYPAYSSIGNDKDSNDRSSWMPTFISDPRNNQETRTGIIRIYSGGNYLDKDIYYESEAQKVFLPEGKAAIGGIVIENSNSTYKQPQGIYVYNGKEYILPIRYLFIGGNLLDYYVGVNSTVYIYANVYDSGAGQQFDLEGAAMYLSEKTMNSLIVKLYLMNDPMNEYAEFELVHEQAQYPFKFNYGGFRGPISIWEVNTEEMTNILVREEFMRTEGEFGEFDDLQFEK